MSAAPSSESSTTMWPAGALSPGTSSAPPSEPKKSKQRHRARKKSAAAASDAAPPPAATPASAAAATPKPKQSQKGGSSQRGGKTDMPWRGSGRGRGRGGTTLTGSSGRGGGAAASAQGGRAFSTAATTLSGGTTSAGEDLGSRIPFARPGEPGSWRRALHTDSSSSANELPPPVPTGGSVRPNAAWRKGKGRQPDKNDLLLQEVGLKEGEDGGLEKELTRLYESQRPSPAAVSARQHLIDELTKWLNAERFHWGHAHNSRERPLKVEAFGSVRFGLGTSNSDLDLCLLDPYRPNGFVEKWFSSEDAMIRDLPDIYNMRKLGRSLQRANLMDVRAIPDAAVPICKFKVMIDGHMIEADLNTNEQLGLFNSRLINSYCNLHPLVRPLSVFIKFWAKQRGLNNPSGSPTTFSSYTFILLVIAYLQRLKLLPNLQSPDLIDQTNTPSTRFYSTPKARSKRHKRIIRSVGWDVTFVEYDAGPPQGYEPEPADLVDLARGFFDYFGAEFDTEREIVSVWNGAPLGRARDFVDPVEGQREKQKEPIEEAARGVEQLKVAEEGEGSVPPLEEEQRKRDEDEVVAAFAAEEQAQAPQPPPATGDEAAANLDSHEADADALEQQRPARPDSRSSEPMEYVDFEEPERWSDHLLVVQDPFILTRNCAGNVHPDWVEELRVQMRRARDLIDARAPLATICQNVAQEAGYMPVSHRRYLERRQMQQQSNRAKNMAKAERKAKKAAVGGPAAAQKEAQAAAEAKKEESAEPAGAPDGKGDGEAVVAAPAGTKEGVQEATEKVAKKESKETREEEKAAPDAVDQQEPAAAGEPVVGDVQKV
ncbi:hypothetical protein JCM6882_006246 [Rhodosporidiobolus microsporus]